MDPSGELNQNKIPFQKICDTFSKKIVPNPTPPPPPPPPPPPHFLYLPEKSIFFSLKDQISYTFTKKIIPLV